MKSDMPEKHTDTDTSNLIKARNVLLIPQEGQQNAATLQWRTTATYTLRK